MAKTAHFDAKSREKDKNGLNIAIFVVYILKIPSKLFTIHINNSTKYRLPALLIYLLIYFIHSFINSYSLP